MGGNALSVTTTRLNRVEHDSMLMAVMHHLQGRFAAQVMPIPFYHTKETFGDLDLIVEKEKICFPQAVDRFEDLKMFVEDMFHARQVVVNDNVVSFDARLDPSKEEGFQVDIIATPLALMQASRDYFSYNDLGNLVGRIAHKMGLSFGHEGLIYFLRDGTHLQATIPVSLDADASLKFLGYDPRRFREGFATLDDIFAYVCSSPYFNKNIYLLENRNHAARVRDRKRPTYQKFLQHLSTVPEGGYDFPEDKSSWLPHIQSSFPDFSERLAKAQAEESARQQLKALFNGEKMKSMTGLEGKELGALLTRVREHYQTPQALLESIAQDELGFKKVVDRLQHGMRDHSAKL